MAATAAELGTLGEVVVFLESFQGFA